MSTKTATRFECVDALRGICALLVALLHCQTYSHIVGVRFFGNAYLFVDFFFVLSGFVIASNYAERLRDGYSLGSFAILRFGRVYPLYLVTLGAFVAMEAVQIVIPSLGAMGGSAPFSAPRQSWDTILANVLLLQSFGGYGFLTWNTPGWSIATEFWTYMCFACVVRYAYGSRVIILAATLVLALGLILALSPHAMNTTFNYGFIRTLAGFSAGALLYEVYKRRHAARWLARANATTLELGAIGLAIAFVTFADQRPVSVLAPFVFAGVVLVFIAEAGRVSRWLKAPAFQMLGSLSYSIYMVHLFLGTYITNLGKLVQSKLGHPMLTEIAHGSERLRVLGTTRIEGDIWLLCILASVLICSWVTYRFIEVPCREWFRDLAAKGQVRRKAAMPASGALALQP